LKMTRKVFKHCSKCSKMNKKCSKRQNQPRALGFLSIGVHRHTNVENDPKHVPTPFKVFQVEQKVFQPSKTSYGAAVCFNRHYNEAKQPTRALNLPPAGRAGDRRNAVPCRKPSEAHAPTPRPPSTRRGRSVAERAAWSRGVRGVVRCGAGVGRAGGGREASSSHYSKPACPNDNNFYFQTLSF